MTGRESVTVRTGWFGRETFPWDEVANLEGGVLVLRDGRRVRLPVEAGDAAARALAPPEATGRLEPDLVAWRRYVAGPWSPVRAAEALLGIAAAAGISDVHVEATPDAVELRVRRVGELVGAGSIDRATGLRLIAALKHLSGCLPYRSDLVQEGRVPRPGVAADVRTSFLPTATGERAALRLFGRLRTLGDLGLPDPERAALEALLAAPSGLVLVAGATGAGKTTTIYAALAWLAASRSGAHLSLEDPVEQRLRAAGIPVDQVELRPERGLDAAAALAGALRQDVDVLAVGEIRTGAEAGLALQAAHTGRLVLAGVHAASTGEARQRLLDLGVDPSVLAVTLRGVVHQRLVPVACEPCAACAGGGRRREARMSVEEVRG